MRFRQLFAFLLFSLITVSTSTAQNDNTQVNNLAIGNKFIDAFYSFNKDSLQTLVSSAQKSQSGILFYQKWAECANYKVIDRTHYFAKNDSTIVFPVTVKDDLMTALAIDFNVTDTFHILLRNRKIVSVTTSSNDVAEYYKAKEWVNKNRPDLVAGCGLGVGDSKACECVLGMIKGFTEYTENKKLTKH